MRDLRIFLIFAIVPAFAVSVGCGGSSSSSSNSSSGTTTTTQTIATSGANVASITVNAGPNGNYVNGAFASITVCVPGTSNCQPIDGILVDTGSSGLRIISSALTVALPQQNASDGNPVVECLPFVDSYTWGPVQTADVQIASEKAASVPIQVLSDTDFTTPTACSQGFPSADTLPALGANGILGVGLAAQDCGSSAACVQTGTAGLYYQCPSSGCVETGEPLAQQVINPVALFTTDNNGVIVELPPVAGAAATVSGSLVFGIGTQSNNVLGTATIYTAPNAAFTTTYKSQTYTESFIDSGSNGYFFPDSTIPICSDNTGFYCPSSTENLSASNQASGASGTVDFSVANADALFANLSDNAFEDLGGPAGGPAPNYFDWGLPFFYGRNVYTAIEGMSTPGGTGPFWAY
ncbi:MAG: DUF3443 domain-containing protein [Candidatus Sulfotelmatobacter sp.]